MKWILILLYSTCFLATQAQEQKLTYETYKSLPAFYLNDTEDKPFLTTAAFGNSKPLVVIYFSPLCTHCTDFIEQITSHLKELKRVNFLMISAYPPAELKTFAITRGLYKMPNIKVGSDKSFGIGKFYAVKEIPAAFVYSKEGKLQNVVDHPTTFAKLQKVL